MDKQRYGLTSTVVNTIRNAFKNGQYSYNRAMAILKIIYLRNKESFNE